MSDMYGSTDERESIATIHAALDAGINLLDSGDHYGSGHNELLISRALRDWRLAIENALVSGDVERARWLDPLCGRTMDAEPGWTTNHARSTRH